MADPRTDLAAKIPWRPRLSWINVFANMCDRSNWSKFCEKFITFSVTGGWRFWFRLCVLTHRCLHNTAPDESLKLQLAAAELRFSNSTTLDSGRASDTSSKSCDRAFPVAAWLLHVPGTPCHLPSELHRHSLRSGTSLNVHFFSHRLFSSTFSSPSPLVHLRMRQWKNYWNRSTVPKVIVKIKVAFLWITLTVHSVCRDTQRCRPRDSCLGSRPSRGSFQPVSPWLCLGDHLPWLCLESPDFVSLLCDYKVCEMIWIYHYCGFFTLQLVLTLPEKN